MIHKPFVMYYGETMVTMARDPEAGLPKLQPNFHKILEAILFVIETGEKKGFCPTQFDIAKTIFLADYHHLKTYGRPITYDNFHALEFGPIPTMTYDMLKPTFNWQFRGLDKAPWHSRLVSDKIREFSRTERSANLKKLSKSDISELEQALNDVRAMGFKKTSDITHKFPAYIEAWNRRGDARAVLMDLRTLLPEFDRDMIENLEFASKHN